MSPTTTPAPVPALDPAQPTNDDDPTTTTTASASASASGPAADSGPAHDRPGPHPAAPGSTPPPPPPPSPPPPPPLTRSTARILAAQSRLTALHAELASLTETRDDLRSKLQYVVDAPDEMGAGCRDDDDDAGNAKAEDTVKRHITLLHNYNAIRDVGMGLCGIIAEGNVGSGSGQGQGQRQDGDGGRTAAGGGGGGGGPRRVKDVLMEFGVEDRD
ncbi:MAG: hypothetical protein M1826_004077 [Phylliscum demangeonii]|nr:MAG: hypothetical protein M1826_004077 [Phylliscum demangeonii]